VHFNFLGFMTSVFSLLHNDASCIKTTDDTMNMYNCDYGTNKQTPWSESASEVY
jgi:hypothetical protein